MALLFAARMNKYLAEQDYVRAREAADQVALWSDIAAQNAKDTALLKELAKGKPWREVAGLKLIRGGK